MSDYRVRAEGSKASARGTSLVNDAVWGSIRITALERVLIDSPIFQRLRRIRQLGGAYFVYPSAGHSRFEHSLGALHRATTLVDAVAGSAESASRSSLLVPAPEIRKWQSAIRVGALLHDVGHLFLSHAGERTIANHGIPSILSSVDEILGQAALDLECEKPPSLSEFLSHSIVCSPSLADLCDHFDLRVDGNPPLRADAVLMLLSGAMIRSRKLVQPPDRWIADILSGPLDVDKQDYVPRDGMMAGVGVQVEPHRCAEVLRVCDFEKARVLNDSKAQREIDPKERRLTITFSGISVLEDVLLARMSLFLRIYRHQKVRLIERLAERVYGIAKEKGLLRLFLKSEDLP